MTKEYLNEETLDKHLFTKLYEIESEIIALKAKLKRLDKKKTKLLEQIKTAREEKYGQGQICDKCEDI